MAGWLENMYDIGPQGLEFDAPGLEEDQRDGSWM